MATPHSALPSPTHADSFNPPQDGAELPLDFLSFMMDGANGYGPNGATEFQADAVGAGAASAPGSVAAVPSPSGTSTRASKAARDAHQAQGQGQDLVPEGQLQPLGPSQMMGLNPDGAFGSHRGMELGLAALWQAQQGGEYDASQANFLQQQLEQMQMQSPVVMDPNNPQSPLHALANMLQPQDGQDLATFPDGQSLAEKWAQFSAAHGVFTPAPSGEMYPQNRNDQVAPMQLDMREGHQEYGIAPLLSPALSQAGSQFTSPVAYYGNQGQNSHLTPIEALQEQQRQFQHQLAVLQHQQRQLEATAAAVANSPYLNTGSSGPSRAVTTPNVSGPHSTASTSSPGYFSPLTSPALESHRSQFVHHQQRGRPHPLSALSSPALNPVGSSGGAQQTLSPAFGPQSNHDLADPELLAGLVGYLDNRNQYTSPQSSTGPNRQSLPGKTRPSPMMKPTLSTRRKDGAFSVPSSPSSAKFPRPPAQLTSLPPAAIQSMHIPIPSNGSTPSTPSPVDLAQIMPPPPVPNDKHPSLSPMTPASMMNMAHGKLPIKPATRKIASAPQAPKRVTSKLAISTAGKRALAMRPPTVAGRNGKAPAPPPPTEGETRKSSHKLAEQRRRDSLKSGFDELRLLLPPINTEALDAETGEPLPGSSAPRLLPKSTLVPDDNPNRGVSKVALLKFSNEYIVRLHDKVEKRDNYIDKLRDEIRRLRIGEGDEVRGDDGEDLLEMDMLEGEEDDLDSSDEADEKPTMKRIREKEGDEDEMDEDDETGSSMITRRKSIGKNGSSTGSGGGVKKSPALLPFNPALGRKSSLKSTR